MTEEGSERRPVLAYVDDILAEIEFLKATSAGLSLEDCLKSGEKRRAIERSLEIISEASRGIPEAERQRYPEIPWRRIHDLGNVIRRAYFGLGHGARSFMDDCSIRLRQAGACHSGYHGST